MPVLNKGKRSMRHTSNYSHQAMISAVKHRLLREMKACWTIEIITILEIIGKRPTEHWLRQLLNPLLRHYVRNDSFHWLLL